MRRETGAVGELSGGEGGRPLAECHGVADIGYDLGRLRSDGEHSGAKRQNEVVYLV